jgi:UDP-xylose:glucoside alpha-1,3-xylosyltransferase
MSSTYGSNDIQVSQENIASKDVNAVINLSVVACGDRAPETLVLLKSALMFTKSRLHFYIFTESTLKNVFVEQFRKWPTFIQNKFEYTIEETSFPQENQNEWRQLFKLCASQRIFLPVKKIFHFFCNLL